MRGCIRSSRASYGPDCIVSRRYGIADWVPARTGTLSVCETRNHIFLWREP